MVEWTKTMLMYPKPVNVLVKGLKVVAKCCVFWILFMMTSIVVLNIQMYYIRLRSSNLPLNVMLKTQLVEYGFGRKCFEVGLFIIL